MDLHCSDNIPEWELIPADQWNKHQLRAHATRGWDTPGNRESIKGTLVTLSGIYMATRESHALRVVGAAMVGYGRYSDIKDGRIAHETGTKSPKGAAIDAGVDTVQLGAAIIAMTRSNLLSVPETLLLSSQKAANVLITSYAESNGTRLKLNHANKISAAGYWAGITLKLAGTALEGIHPESGSVLRKAGTATILASFGISLNGTLNLARQASRQTAAE